MQILLKGLKKKASDNPLLWKLDIRIYILGKFKY